MNKTKLIYVYDPMCGWCYGFSPVIKLLEEKYKHKYDFEILSGGMVVGEREGPIGSFADYILSAYKRVEQTTGIKFGEAYLNLLRKKEYFSSSVKPSVALNIIKDHYPELAISFAHEMQKAFYYEGKLLHEDSSYNSILMGFNIDKGLFFKNLNNETYLQKTKLEFEFVSKLGVNGFPAILGVKNNQYYLLASGYKSFDEIEKIIQEFDK